MSSPRSVSRLFCSHLEPPLLLGALSSEQAYHEKPVAVSLYGASLNPGIRVRRALLIQTHYTSPVSSLSLLVGGFLPDAEGAEKSWLALGADLESHLIGGASFS